MAKKIKIGDEIFSREEIFRLQEEMIKERAKLTFEEKIKALIRIQKLAKAFGKDVFVWEVEMYDVKGSKGRYRRS